MIDLEQVTIELKATLSDIVGTYTTLAGDTTPAISWQDGSARQIEYRKQGLEVVIRLDPSVRIQFFVGGAYLQTIQGIMYLYQHDLDKNAADYGQRAIAALSAVDPSIQVLTSQVTGTHRDVRLNSVAQLLIPFQFVT